jgi:hypothetical protein
MLNTINGFDLLLIIIITILGFKVYNLKQETKSMTTGLTNIMNELIVPLQKLIHHNGCNCTTCYIRVQPPADLYGCVCNYCTDSDPWLSECQDSIGTPPFDYNKEVATPTEARPKCTAPDPMKCDCDDCWLIPTKYF